MTSGAKDDAPGEGGALEAFPGVPAAAPRGPVLPRNPAVTAQEARLRNPAKFGLDRKQSFGVPRVKNHKELLKGVFGKNKPPPSLLALRCDVGAAPPRPTPPPDARAKPLPSVGPTD